MPEYIHARQMPEGICFRTWSSVIDAYTSGEMDEEQLRLLLLYRALEREARPYPLQDRISRARSYGTSEYNNSRSLNSDWDQEEIDEDGDKDDGEYVKLMQEYAKGNERLKTLLESILSNWEQVSEGFYSG